MPRLIPLSMAATAVCAPATTIAIGGLPKLLVSPEVGPSRVAESVNINWAAEFRKLGICIITNEFVLVFGHMYYY